jgi:hypothetical protein
MTNDFSQIPSESESESEFRNSTTIDPEETPIGEAYGDGAGNDEQPYDGGGWPGDGSGTDDLADYNANEADDYSNE